MHLQGDAHSPIPNPVGRVIEDLERTGYRPLHRSLTVEPATITGAPLGTGATPETARWKSGGGAIPRWRRERHDLHRCDVGARGAGLLGGLVMKHGAAG